VLAPLGDASVDARGAWHGGSRHDPCEAARRRGLAGNARRKKGGQNGASAHATAIPISTPQSPLQPLTHPPSLSRDPLQDVEGYEALVIGGAERFLTEGQPPVAMLIEVSGNQIAFTRLMAKFEYQRLETPRSGNNILYLHTPKTLPI